MWPTPMTTDENAVPYQMAHGKKYPRLLGSARGEVWLTPSASNPNETEDPETWATRRATLAEKHGNNGCGMPLGQAVKLWPTPTVQDGENDAGPSQFSRNTLPLNAQVVREAPDPPVTGQCLPGRYSTNGSRHGLLNDRWVLTLMGFPADWLDPILEAAIDEQQSKARATRSSHKRPS